MTEDVRYIVDFPNMQKEQKDIDKKLLKNLLDLIKDKTILRRDDLFFIKVNGSIKFLSNLENEIKKLKFSFFSDKKNKEYQDYVMMREKHENAVELADRLFRSLKPHGLPQSYMDLFSMLKEFQEISFKYQENFRDHLIHSFRAFLLITSIIKEFDKTWIRVLREFLRCTLQRLSSDINSQDFLEAIDDEELWRFSVEGAFVMALFHDIGLVYSEYSKMIEGLKNRVFLEDRSLYSIKTSFILIEEFETEKEKILDQFKEIIEKMHPEYKKIVSELMKELEKIRKYKGDPEEEKPSHGAIAFFNIYRTRVKDFKKDLQKADLAGIQAKLDILFGKIDTRFGFSEGTQQELSYEPGAMRAMWKTDAEGFYDELIRETKEDIRKLLNILILWETLNSILIHDMEKFAYLSPFSELLVFADVSQEWDRLEYEKGKREEYKRKEIRVCIEACSETRAQILSFYEKGDFKDQKYLNNLTKKCERSYEFGAGKGRFWYFFYLCAIDDKHIDLRSRAIFPCSHSKKKTILKKGVKSISPKDFCSNCKKRQVRS